MTPLRAVEAFIAEEISGERLAELLGVNPAEVMVVTSWVNNAKALQGEFLRLRKLAATIVAVADNHAAAVRIGTREALESIDAHEWHEALHQLRRVLP
jgi:kynureninase